MQAREEPPKRAHRSAQDQREWAHGLQWLLGRGTPFPQVGQPGALEAVDQEGVPAQGTEAEAQELRGVYIISVAARLLHMHPQTLRKYERIGLVSPSRTVGMLRLYSEEDIAKLRLIKHLVEELKLNLAGVELTIGLVQRLLNIRRQALETREASQLRHLISQELEGLMVMLERNLPQDHEHRTWQ